MKIIKKIEEYSIKKYLKKLLKIPRFLNINKKIKNAAKLYWLIFAIFLLSVISVIIFYWICLLKESSQAPAIIEGVYINDYKNPQIPENEKSELKIGYITDAHCSYVDEDMRRGLNRECREGIPYFIREMNNVFRPDFVLEGGDLADEKADKYVSAFNNASRLLNRSNSKVYHVLGNHELWQYPRETWLKSTGYEKGYYYFDVREFRVIVLDGNYKLKSNGEEESAFPSRFYTGYVNQEQYKWLINLLKESKNKEKIVFIHQPPFFIKGESKIENIFQNGREIRKILSYYGVRAVLAGHIEEMCYYKNGMANYYALKGLSKENGSNPFANYFSGKEVFYEITITKDREINVEMIYKKNDWGERGRVVLDDSVSGCQGMEMEIFDIDDDEYDFLADEGNN